MKKKLLIIGLCISCIGGISSLQASGVEPSQESSSVSSRQFESGKWVAVYGGSSRPEKCVCVKSTFRTQCMVGDFTTNLSLCE